MKKLVLAIVLAGSVGAGSVHAGGFRGFHGCYRGGFHCHDGFWWGGPAVSVSFGAWPGAYWYEAPSYAYYYPSYSYYPAETYAEYSRPNYAVSGTLAGALAGGLIGNSIHHQGWEGAGIGAAAGLLLGGLAEHEARVQETSALPAAVNYRAAAVPDAPVVSSAPVAPAAPRVPDSRPESGANPMSSANSLFGR